MADGDYTTLRKSTLTTFYKGLVLRHQNGFCLEIGM